MQITDRELQTAVQLVEALSIDWDPQEYHDTYQERVLQLVEAKRTGETLEKGEPPPRSTNVIDLMDALQASVARARGGKETEAEKQAAPPGRKPTRLQDAAEKRRTGRGAKKAVKKAVKGAERKLSTAAELDELSKSELYRRASEADIPGRSSMGREELIKALSGGGGRRTARVS
jgi:DNA end-binding protein Ku